MEQSNKKGLPKAEVRGRDLNCVKRWFGRHGRWLLALVVDYWFVKALCDGLFLDEPLISFVLVPFAFECQWSLILGLFVHRIGAR